VTRAVYLLLHPCQSTLPIPTNWATAGQPRQHRQHGQRHPVGADPGAEAGGCPRLGEEEGAWVGAGRSWCFVAASIIVKTAALPCRACLTQLSIVPHRLPLFLLQYGSVAYPKHHTQKDISDIYLFAAVSWSRHGPLSVCWAASASLFARRCALRNPSASHTCLAKNVCPAISMPTQPQPCPRSTASPHTGHARRVCQHRAAGAVWADGHRGGGAWRAHGGH